MSWCILSSEFWEMHICNLISSCIIVTPQISRSKFIFRICLFFSALVSSSTLFFSFSYILHPVLRTSHSALISVCMTSWHVWRLYLSFIIIFPSFLSFLRFNLSFILIFPSLLSFLHFINCSVTTTLFRQSSSRNVYGSYLFGQTEISFHTLWEMWFTYSNWK